MEIGRVEKSAISLLLAITESRPPLPLGDGDRVTESNRTANGASFSEVRGL